MSAVDAVTGPRAWRQIHNAMWRARWRDHAPHNAIEWSYDGRLYVTGEHGQRLNIDHLRKQGKLPAVIHGPWSRR